MLLDWVKRILSTGSVVKLWLLLKWYIANLFNKWIKSNECRLQAKLLSFISSISRLTLLIWSKEHYLAWRNLLRTLWGLQPNPGKPGNDHKNGCVQNTVCWARLYCLVILPMPCYAFLSVNMLKLLFYLVGWLEFNVPFQIILFSIFTIF